MRSCIKLYFVLLKQLLCNLQFKIDKSENVFIKMSTRSQKRKTSFKKAMKFFRNVQNSDPNRSRNMVTGVLDHSINVSKKNSEPPTVRRASLHNADTLRLGNKDEHTLIEQRNPNAKWRLCVNLLILNELKFDDYTNNIQPVSKLSDAVQHLSRRSITAKRDSKSWQYTLWGVIFAQRRVN